MYEFEDLLLICNFAMVWTYLCWFFVTDYGDSFILWFHEFFFAYGCGFSFENWGNLLECILFCVDSRMLSVFFFLNGFEFCFYRHRMLPNSILIVVDNYILSCYEASWIWRFAFSCNLVIAWISILFLCDGQWNCFCLWFTTSFH